MAEEPINCVASIEDVPSYADESPAGDQKVEVKMDVARAGSKAPDFAGMAYIDGGFKKVQLSDYAGKWIMVCFYPGDFTFV